MIVYRTGYGEDSHALAEVPQDSEGVVTLAGVKIPCSKTIIANSDGDIVWHAFCRAIQSLTAIEILGARADKLVQAGQTNSRSFLHLALHNLQQINTKIRNLQISQIAIQIEAKSPKLAPYFANMRKNIHDIILDELQQNLLPEQIGIAAMTGEGLTSCGRGEGINVKVLLTVRSEIIENEDY